MEQTLINRLLDFFEQGSAIRDGGDFTKCRFAYCQALRFSSLLSNKADTNDLEISYVLGLQNATNHISLTEN